MDDSAPEPAVKFKRRKTTHPKRTRLDTEDEPAVAIAPTANQSPDTVPAHPDANPTPEGDSTSLALKEILRNRKRPRDRLREAAARAELTKAQAVALREQDAPKQGYTDRFVPQTGQVIDKDDQQITEYIEARQAEKNHRLYGWPIPQHLVAAVARLAPEPTQTALSPSTESRTIAGSANRLEDNEGGDNAEKSYRLAAGMGKLQEIDLGPSATSHNVKRTEAAWKKLEGGQPEETPAAAKVRLGRDGKPRRQPKRRNSEDIRRDQMVEAVLREAKLDFFDEDISSAPISRGANNDEALVEQFRLEFLESIESRQQRKPAAPTSGVKGAKEAPKGPKLGGSRNARAAMRAQEEQAAKNKR